MVRQQTGLEHNTYDILEEPALLSTLPENTKILTHLLEREVSDAIKTKGDKTIASYSREDLVFAFTDGSSVETLNNEGAGVNFPQSGSTKHFKFGGGKIASNYNCELIAIHKALEEYLKLEENERAKGLIIFSDCRAALQAILRGTSRLITDIHRTLHKIFHLKKQ